MLLPLIVGAGASALGAGARYAGARAQANAMMPDEYRKQLEELRAREAAGQLGLEPAQRSQMEGDFAAQRGAIMADAQARQLAQAQAMAGAAPMTGRDFFLQEVAAQQVQQQALAAQEQQLRAADEAARAQNEQMLLELAQRDASMQAAKRQAGWTLGADLVKLGADAGLTAYGMSKLDEEEKALLDLAENEQLDGRYERADELMDQAMRARLAMGRMYIDMAGAFGAPGASPDYLTGWAAPPPAPPDEDGE